MSSTIKLLFIAANSTQGNQRRFIQEAREIRNRIRLGKYRDSFELITSWGVRLSDLQALLLEHQPHIVHFSARGTPERGTIFEGDNGIATLVDNKAMAELFRILKDNIRVMVFNAGHSEQQARELTHLVDYSIAIDSAMSDEEAIRFSAAFYQALVYARTVSEAFDLAKLELRIEDPATFAAPVLRIDPSVDISEPFLISSTRMSANEFAAIERYSRMARQGLDPHILPRVSRRVVREKYLPAILRAVAEGRGRVIPIVGSAGYGKSTILGDIYDDLTKAGPAWIALVRCNDLTIDESRASVVQLSLALGEVASGSAQSIFEMARILTASRGAGVLLIDTVDLILNEQLIPALRGTLIQLVDSGATVVFTCRDYEYVAFLEPTSQRLAGISESMDRYQVPQFAREEIEAATLGFIQNSQDPGLRERGQLFARSILELSSDNRPLTEIVSNPLLLAMLCDLFGAEGLVPDDLTVSKLYEQYWEERIGKSRKYGPRSAVAMQKRKLCLDIAKAIFQPASEYFHESVYESDLELVTSDVVAAAYEELLSEGVLKTQPTTRISFFHQTFLEYMIARWLATRSGATQREEFLDSLAADRVGAAKPQRWSVARQLLTIVDRQEFDRIVQRLDLRDLAAFRVVAYAAASKGDPAQVCKLLPEALELGDEHQSILRNAIESAPGPLAEAAWQVAVELVAQSKWRTAVKAAQTAGALLARRGATLGHCLAGMFEAIERRYLNEKLSSDEKESRDLVGWFLSAILGAVDRGISPAILQVLQAFYPRLTDAHRATIIRLHLVPGAARNQQRSLFQIVVAEAAPRRLKEELTMLLEQLLPELIDRSDPTYGSTLFDALHAQLPGGWGRVQAKAVGRHLQNDQVALEAIVHDLFRGDQSRIPRNQTALVEAIQSSAAAAVLSVLTRIPVATISARRIGVLVSIFQSLAVSIDVRAQEGIVEWIKPILMENPDKLAAAVVKMCDESASLKKFLTQLLLKLPKNQRARVSKRIVKAASAATFSSIASELESQLLEDLPNIESELALVEFYGIRAENSSPALARLIGLSLGESGRVARAASRNIAKNAAKLKPIDAKHILPLAQSGVVGVRMNWLDALIRMIEAELPIDEQDIVDAYAALDHETQEPVFQNLCQVTSRWVRLRKRAPPAIALAFDKFARRLIEDGLAGSGTVRALIIALKIIVQSEDPSLPRQINDLARTLLLRTNLERVRDGESETVDLLSAVARQDRTFLPKVVADCAALPWRNARAVTSAVKRVEGAASSLLDEMLAAEWCAPEVKNFILELRGL
jgi:hypothetical protein